MYVRTLRSDIHGIDGMGQNNAIDNTISSSVDHIDSITLASYRTECMS